MGIKSRKRIRKNLEFYSSTFGFREPYKVLVDGNFLHFMRETQLCEVQDVLGKACNAKFVAYSTKCVSWELREMGSEFAETLIACRKLKLHKCEHEKAVPASQCLLEQVGKDNEDNWWIATQDDGLVQKLHDVPNAPSFRMTVNGLTLQKPSDKSVRIRDKMVRKSMHVSEWEKKTKAMKDVDFSGSQKAGVRVEKKKAKAPNPLACKKKKKRKQEVEEKTSEVPKKKRQRRKKKPQESTEG
ncbi:hypothetical protein BSKO_00817 [Bryopsis sp. KO-2023]|nr:hypothetical protein BSKO_00817 [Bryopsis sp. KO-2023]